MTEYEASEDAGDLGSPTSETEKALWGNKIISYYRFNRTTIKLITNNIQINNEKKALGGAGRRARDLDSLERLRPVRPRALLLAQEDSRTGTERKRTDKSLGNVSCSE